MRNYLSAVCYSGLPYSFRPTFKGPDSYSSLKVRAISSIEHALRFAALFTKRLEQNLAPWLEMPPCIPTVAFWKRTALDLAATRLHTQRQAPDAQASFRSASASTGSKSGAGSVALVFSAVKRFMTARASPAGRLQNPEEDFVDSLWARIFESEGKAHRAYAEEISAALRSLPHGGVRDILHPDYRIIMGLGN